jgi:hypothetical protein
MGRMKKLLFLISFTLLGGCSNPHLEIFPELDNLQLMDNKISANLLKEDIQSYYLGALARHPHLDRYAGGTELEKSVAELQALINKPMSRLEFYRIAGQLTYKFNDGHSMLLWPYPEYQLLQKAGHKTFPFEVSITKSQESFIKNTYQSDDLQLRAGSKIVAINNVPINKLLDHMQKFVGGESQYLRVRFAANRFGLMLWAVFGLIDDFELQYEEEGKRKTLTVSMSQNWRKNNVEEKSNEDFYLKELPNNVAYLYIGHFDIEPDWFEHFIDLTFKKIKDENMTSLIIDVRDNTGGNTDTATYLASYVANKKFKMISNMEEKLNENNRGVFSYKGEIGELVKTPWEEWTTPISKEKRFTGQTYLLISPITYSSGIVFASSLKDNDFATLIGQKTGGNANQTAQGNLFNLPNSQLRAYITTRMLVRPSGSMKIEGVKPDYEIIHTEEAIREAQDLGINKALELISTH